MKEDTNCMAKSSKLVAAKRGRVLLVRRRRDQLWMFPGGRKRGRETEKDCLRREIREELPKLKLGRLTLWKEVRAKNRRSGRKMSDAIFVAKKASGPSLSVTSCSPSISKRAFGAMSALRPRPQPFEKLRICKAEYRRLRRTKIPATDFRSCEGLRMPAHEGGAAGTG